MSRQINLIDGGLRPLKMRLTAPVMLAAMGLVYLIALLFSFSQIRSIGILRDELATISAEHGKAKVELASARALAKGRVADPGARTEISKLESKATRLNELLVVLSGGVRERANGATDSDGRGGFSGQVAALARRRVEGVWLTRIVMDNPDRRLQLAGRMLRPELLPRYVDALRADPTLQGQEFDGAKMARIIAPSPMLANLQFVEFTLGTPEAGPSRSALGAER
jgi:hypothetical protein